MVNVAVYHRVSTVDQNPALARDELHAVAARLGANVVLSIEEKGSGARNDRPGLQRVLDAARRGEIDAVMCWKLDRFGRSVLDVLSNVRALEAAGVRFIVTTQGLDVRPGGDAMSRLILSVLASVAEFERDLIRERTRLGLRKARADGKRIGRPAVLPPSATAQAKALRAAGHSWAQVASALGCAPSTARRAAAR
jgi:DNA invertase Pin-like site-specific DNA recombinase